jgi:hypothetical protein
MFRKNYAHSVHSEHNNVAVKRTYVSEVLQERSVIGLKKAEAALKQVKCETSSDRKVKYQDNLGKTQEKAFSHFESFQWEETDH